jgi:hypothetical protein
VKGSARFIMNGGIIKDNTATIAGLSAACGGGVAVQSEGEFQFKGGTISGNTATLGGGVWVTGSKNSDPNYSRTGLFTMTGGDITGNTADDAGGGVYLDEYATITKTGGTIHGNNAPHGTEVVAAGTRNAISNPQYVPLKWLDSAVDANLSKTFDDSTAEALTAEKGWTE